MTAAEYRKIRKHLGTQAEVAALLGVDRVTVSKRENGDARYPISKEAALALRQLEDAAKA